MAEEDFGIKINTIFNPISGPIRHATQQNNNNNNSVQGFLEIVFSLLLRCLLMACHNLCKVTLLLMRRRVKGKREMVFFVFY